MLRRRVSADPAVLDALHASYPWIPDSASVRPSLETCASKDAYLSSHPSIVTEILGETLSSSAAPFVFRLLDQPFPYQVPRGTVHLVAWFSSGIWSDAALTGAIAQAIDQRGGGDFVYYTNPKKSIVLDELDHVQVFWQHP